MNIDATPFQYLNWTANKGDAFEKTLEIANEDNTPFDLTGYTVKMEVRAKEGGPVIELFTIEDNSIVITPGEITIIKDAITGVSGHYYYDIQLTKDGKNRTILSGRFVIRPDYTE